MYICNLCVALCESPIPLHSSPLLLAVSCMSHIDITSLNCMKLTINKAHITDRNAGLCVMYIVPISIARNLCLHIFLNVQVDVTALCWSGIRIQGNWLTLLAFWVLEDWGWLGQHNGDSNSTPKGTQLRPTTKTKYL